MLEGTVLELLRNMIEEADDLPQAQLDVLLVRLLPAHAAEAPASHAAAAALLQRCETLVQPHLQKLVTALLTGARTDSELKDDYHSLFYAVRGGGGLVWHFWACGDWLGACCGAMAGHRGAWRGREPHF